MNKFVVKTISALAMVSTSGLAMADGSGGVDVAKNFGVLLDLAGIIGAAIGFFLFAGGLFQIYEANTGRSDKKVGKAFLTMLTGAFMISAGWVYELLKGSFMSGSKNGLDLSQGQMSLALDTAAANASGAIGSATGLSGVIPPYTIDGIIAFVFFVGFVCFLSGVFAIKEIGDSRSENPVMKPIMRIIGGMLCMNILWFGCMLTALLGIPGLCAE